MANNLKKHYPPAAQSYVLLLQESREIYNEISDLGAELHSSPEELLINQIQHKFWTYLKTWKSVRESLRRKIAHYKHSYKKLINKPLRSASLLTADMKNKKKHLKIREVKIKAKQRYVGKSLTQIRNMWDDSLKFMRKKISTQLIRNSFIEKEIEDFEGSISNELESVLNLTCIDGKKTEEDNERNSLLGSLKDIPLIKVTSPMSDSREYSRAFHELMKDMEDQEETIIEKYSNVSMEKNDGEWKSDFESEANSILQVDASDVKSAIKILQKANLLSPELIKKLTELINEEPGNSQKLELFLQIFSLNGGPGKFEDRKEEETTENRGKAENDKSKDESVAFPQSMAILSKENPELSNFLKKIFSKSQALKDFRIEESFNIPLFVDELKLSSIEFCGNKPIIENSDSKAPKRLLKRLKGLSPRENKTNPARKHNQVIDYQSTGMSSQSGLRSRITLKTAGSENSQKIFTAESKSF